MSDELNPQNPEAVQFLNGVAQKDLEIAGEYLPADPGSRQAFDELYSVILERIEEMIDRDFESLLRLLYRTDVNEYKLKSLLDSSPPEKAADIITRMFIGRQLEKYETRQKFSSGSSEGGHWSDDL